MGGTYDLWLDPTRGHEVIRSFGESLRSETSSTSKAELNGECEGRLIGMFDAFGGLDSLAMQK